MAVKGATRDRLLDAGLHLLALQGFSGTAVRDLEEAAGLTPGRGSFYRHFADKEALLAAVLDREISQLKLLRDVQQRTVAGSLGDVRAELILEFRLILRGLDSIRDLINLLAREYGNFPVLMGELRAALIDESRQLTTQDLQARMARGEIRQQDAAALTSALHSALIGYHLTRTYFDSTPGGVEEEAFVRTLVELVLPLSC